MTKLNEVLVNETEELKNAILNAEMTGIKERYCNYLRLNNNDIQGPVEKEFLTNLKGRVSDFMCELIIERVKNSSKEDLLAIIAEHNKHGIYGFSDQICNDGEAYVFDNEFGNEDIQEDVKKEMLSVLEYTIKKMDETEAERIKRLKEANLKEMKDSITSYEQRIENCKKHIAQLEAELAE